jgi:putative peptidoglycan lipid II flippase
LAALAAICGPLVPLLARGFAADDALIARSAFVLLTPALLVAAFSQTWELILTTDGAPLRGALTPAARPLVLAVGLATMPELRVTVLPGLLLLGHIVECALAGVLLRARGWSLIPAFKGQWAALRPALRQYLALIATSLLTCASALTDQMVAARLVAGSIASLAYAQRLTAPLVIISLALINGIFLPRALDHVALGDAAGLRREVHRAMRLAAVLATVPSVVLLILASPIVALVYRRGSFTDTDVATVSYVVRFAVMHAPFAVVANVINRAMLARNATHLLVRISITFPIVNLVCDVAFAPFFGAGGIALSTVVTNVYALACFYVIFRKDVRPPE